MNKPRDLNELIRARCSGILKQRLQDYVFKLSSDGSHMDEADVVREALVEYLNRRAVNLGGTARPAPESSAAVENILRSAAQAVQAPPSSEAGKPIAPTHSQPGGAARKKARKRISSSESDNSA